MSKLDVASAAATLTDYMNTWAKKKFVLNSRRRRCRRRSSSQQGASTTDRSPAISPRHSAISVLPVTSSGITRVTAPAVVREKHPKLFGTEDRLVIDSGCEDYNSCEAGERDQSSLSCKSEGETDVNRCPLKTRSCDCVDWVHDQKADVVTEINAQLKHHQRHEMRKYSDGFDWRCHPASSSFSPHCVDKHSSSTAPNCLETAALTYSTVTRKTGKPVDVQSAAVADADCCDSDDVIGGQQRSSATDDVTVRVKKRWVDLEEHSSVDVD